VKPDELITGVARRMTMVRRLNFALAMLLPVACLFASWTLIRYGFVPRRFAFLLYGSGGIILGAAAWRCFALAAGVSRVDAAALIDRLLESKERFVTITSFPRQAPGASRSIIEQQSSDLARQFVLVQAVPLAWEKPAKLCAAAAMPLILLGSVILVFDLSGPFAPDAAALARGRENAQVLRQMAENSPLLPEQIKDDLHSIAAALEDEGIDSMPALAALDEALVHVDENLANEKGGAEAEEQAADNLKGAKSQPSKNEPPVAEERTKQGQENTARQRPEPQQSMSSEAQGRMPEKKETQPEEKAGGTEQQGDAEKPALGKREDGDREEAGSSPAEQNQQGENSKEEQSADGDKSAQSREAKGGQEPADDPKKDVTGVGEGKGKGRAGSKKEIGGEAQSGSDDRGAKDGAAKNQAEGENEGESSGNGTRQESKGAGKQGQRQPGSSTGENKQGDAANLSDVKNKLEELKQEMSPGEKEAHDEAKDGAQEGKKERAGSDSAQKEAGENGTKQGMKPQEQRGAGEKKEGENSGSQPGNQAQGARQGKKGSGEQQEANGADDRDREAAQEGRNGEEAGKDQSAGDKMKGGESVKNADGAEHRAPSGAEKSKSAGALPSPNQKAVRYGPFGGGLDGALAGQKTKMENVEIPREEEKIVVRKLGKAENKQFRSRTGSTAKTKVESTEFSKPESNIDRARQPIPVEYGDILR